MNAPAWSHRSLFRRALVLACASMLSGSIPRALAQSSARSAEQPFLLRSPSLSRDKIAFVYADDIWTVPREGGEARRLTSGSAVIAGPYYSPDGSQIAYSTRENGVDEVYVIGAGGGVPRRVTWDP